MKRKKKHKLEQPAIKLTHRAKSYKLPTHLTEELCWLIGYMFGNGSCNSERNTIRFYVPTKRPVVYTEVCYLLKKLFGYDAGSYTKEGKKVTHVLLCSKQIYTFLMANGLTKTYSHSLVMPEIIRQDEKMFWAFWCGLFDADGCFQQSKCGGKYKLYEIKIGLTAEEFIKDLQDILVECGFVVRYSISKREHNDINWLRFRSDQFTQLLDKMSMSIQAKQNKEKIEGGKLWLPKSFGSTKYRLTREDGSFVDVNSIKKFATENNMYDSGLYAVKNGKAKSSYGFIKVEKIP